jgi:deoxycytidylate deaminase
MKRSVGAVLVKNKRLISSGYNGTPMGFKNCYEYGCERCNKNSVKIIIVDSRSGFAQVFLHSRRGERYSGSRNTQHQRQHHLHHFVPLHVVHKTTHFSSKVFHQRISEKLSTLKVTTTTKLSSISNKPEFKWKKLTVLSSFIIFE